MLFNSYSFLMFFCVVFSINYFLKGTFRLRYIFLLLASYFFYMRWNNYYLLLILLSTAIDYSASLKISSTKTSWLKKFWLTFSLATNLCILGIFKYYGFFMDSAYVFFREIGLPFSYPTLQLLLPVGISFYTFQSMSYTIDVYKNTIEPEKNFIRFALFVAFFPQLVAGPIVRPHDFLPQLSKKYSISFQDFLLGMNLIWMGLLKKVVLADFLALYSDAYFSNMSANHSLFELLLGVYCFSFQIYFDFSGYTDTAIGCAKLLGFNIPRNFNFPYVARSFSEFWRRWHISLSSWFRDYVYIPLGGNRKRKDFNIMVTFFLSGLWHGAAWHFVLWGGFHGILLVFENFKSRITRPSLSWGGQALRWFCTFNIICFSWILFRVEGLSDLIFLKNHIFALQYNIFTVGQIFAILLIFLWMLLEFMLTKFPFQEVWATKYFVIQILFHVFVLCAVIGVGSLGKAFLYFQF